MMNQTTVFSSSRMTRLRRRVVRSLFGIGGATLVLAVLGVTYQNIGTALDRRRYPAPGELVSVGDHRLHIRVMGNHHYGPTVVLESGLGIPSEAWAWIQPEVAKFARVVSYDRAGLGWSEPSNKLSDARYTAEQLHILLKEANIPGPYILVGHSMGGLYVRQFTALYPKEVAGLVMVDVSHPDQLTRLPQPVVEMQLNTLRLYQNLPVLAYFGILRATNLHRRIIHFDTLPPKARVATESFYVSVTHLQAMKQEAQMWGAITAQIRHTGSLGDRSLRVLSANPKVEDSKVEWFTKWQSLHAELAKLSTKGEHQLVDGADHLSLLLNPHHARTVTAAIRDVVMQVQH